MTNITGMETIMVVAIESIVLIVAGIMAIIESREDIKK
jgi:hypothetical protein